MEQIRYRVEAYIVPVSNNYRTTSVTSESEDAKTNLNIINNSSININETESKCTENYKNDLLSMEEESMQNVKNCLPLEKFVTTNYIDVNKTNKSNSDTFCSLKSSKYKKLYDVQDACFPSSMINNVHTNQLTKLTPIDEKTEEFEEKVTDLCYHGCKNGCSASVPTPQEVSEEVFKGNWLEKLKDINEREASLRNKEVMLQNRERALLRKEREIKILEHRLKVNVEPTTKPAEFQTNGNPIEKSDNIDINKFSSYTKNVCMQNTYTTQIEQLYKDINNIEITNIDLQQEKSSIGSSCSSDNSTSEGKQLKQESNLKCSIISKPTCCKVVSNNSNTATKFCKSYYDDLDSTLSADIGDSSFVQTSQKFNPNVYKRPYAFRRSASERRGKYASKGSSINLEVQNVDAPKEKIEMPIGIEQDKVLERVAKNIVASQDKGTKFQHYGLIDLNVDTTNKAYKVEDEKKYSYLNLETSNKLCLHQKATKGSKDRPISWNEESNHWLQKKRKAYNMTMKKVSPEDIEDKENLRCGIKPNKSEKVIKKIDIRNKILTIFR
ncbi:uncharacterized protein LOC128895160 [Hylaeus anthracinus]|uniref:uncharacterized protein LOC128895160 n=1 Tax=Hylaeus anthracinus TaxID=313031 RepID=UPI0023B999B5|nr:uncharacterized protein LOC128895160 [Hylaeus anthracinus]